MVSWSYLFGKRFRGNLDVLLADRLHSSLTFTGFIIKLILEITDDLSNNWRQLFAVFLLSRPTIKSVINHIPKFKAGGDTLGFNLLLIKNSMVSCSV